MNHSTKHDRDSLDDLLHAYFRAEMPQPWPNFQRTQLPARQATPWTEVSSRWALAAAVALLLGAGYFLSGSLSSPTATPFGPLGPGSASKQPLPEMPALPMND
jgi:hypothetical protein